MKMAEKFKPPGVVTPAGGAGYKVETFIQFIFKSSSTQMAGLSSIFPLCSGNETKFLH